MNIPPRSLLREDSGPRIGWDALQVISGLLTGLYLPYCALAAPEFLDGSLGLWGLLSGIGIIDIWLQSKTPFEIGGEFEHRPDHIFKHYLKRWLFPDLISNSAILLAFINPAALGALQLPRCSKVFRVISSWEHLPFFNPLVLRISRYSLGLGNLWTNGA